MDFKRWWEMQVWPLINYLKEVLVVVVIFFGSLIYAFDELERLLINNKTIRSLVILMIPLFIVLLVKVILLYREKEQITYEWEKDRKRYTNYRYKLINREILFEPDGSNLDTKNFVITVLSDELPSVHDEVILWESGIPFSFTVEFAGSREEAKNSEIKFKKFIDGKEFKYYIIDFLPALKPEEEANYTIKEKAGAGMYSMTLDNIYDQMKIGKWPIRDPVEFIRVPIHAETERLAIRVIFPIDFHISTDEFFDVTLFRSPNRYKEEYERIEKKKYFKQMKDIANGKRILDVDIPNPKEGLIYWIKWQPPIKSDYENFLEKYNRNI